MAWHRATYERRYCGQISDTRDFRVHRNLQNLVLLRRSSRQKRRSLGKQNLELFKKKSRWIRPSALFLFITILSNYQNDVSSKERRALPTRGQSPSRICARKLLALLNVRPISFRHKPTDNSKLTNPRT